MFLDLYAPAGLFVGTGSIAALYFKWRGDFQQPYALALAWTGITASVALWGMAYKPDVGIPFGILLMTLVALGLVLRGADLKAIAPFPGVRSGAAETPVRISWPSVVARSLSAIVAAPMAGMVLGLVVWAWTPGHESTRFAWAVVVFLVGCAALQVWGLCAVRPWRALCLIVLVGLAGVVPVIVGL